jgi:hypothetical protein
MQKMTIQCLLNNTGEHGQSQEIGPVIWPHFDLIFVHTGQIQLEWIDSEQILINSRQAILIYPKTRFRGNIMTSTSKISVHHFDFDATGDDLPSILIPLINKHKGYQQFPHCDNTQIERDIERMVTLAFLKPSPMHNDMRSALMLLILGQLQSAALNPTPSGS